MASCCMVNWRLSFFRLLNCYIQIWKLGYGYSETNLTSAWLANVSLGIADCSFYTCRIALEDDYHKKRIDMLAYTPVEFNYFENLAETFVNPARQNQFIQENIFNNAPVRRITIAMNTNSAFTRFYTESPF